MPNDFAETGANTSVLDGDSKLLATVEFGAVRGSWR
jgi:hypothetical protein